MGNTEASLVSKKAKGSTRILKKMLALDGRDFSPKQKQESDNNR